ncbi:hypothetical protein PCE1_003589 [Barthelona sp. PCE]
MSSSDEEYVPDDEWDYEDEAESYRRATNARKKDKSVTRLFATEDDELNDIQLLEKIRTEQTMRRKTRAATKVTFTDEITVKKVVTDEERAARRIKAQKRKIVMRKKQVLERERIIEKILRKKAAKTRKHEERILSGACELKVDSEVMVITTPMGTTYFTNGELNKKQPALHKCHMCSAAARYTNPHSGKHFCCTQHSGG